MAKTIQGFWGQNKRGFNSLVIGTTWSLWMQRNMRAFHRAEQFKGPLCLALQILDESREEKLAGVGICGLDRFVRS